MKYEQTPIRSAISMEKRKEGDRYFWSNLESSREHSRSEAQRKAYKYFIRLAQKFVGKSYNDFCNKIRTSSFYKYDQVSQRLLKDWMLSQDLEDFKVVGGILKRK